MASSPNIVIVGIDFGTFSSTFAYCNNCNVNAEIVTNNLWPEQLGVFKTNTVLQYDNELKVISWGIVPKPEKKKKYNPIRSSTISGNGRTNRSWTTEPNVSRTTSLLIENRQTILASLFKIHLANVLEEDKPPLPIGLDYRKCVSDYFSEMTKVIKNTISARWPGVNFYRDVKFLITVPLNFSEGAKDIVRYCVSEAGLLDHATSPNLEFLLEPAAASIYCINDLRQVRLNPYSNFMLVDIGGGSILIAIYKLSADGKPNELMEYSSNLCGSAYIDKEFIRYLCENFDLYDALQRLQTNNYDQLQYLAQEFCQKAKFSFTGDPSNFKPISIDLEDTCPAILKYVTGDVRDNMIDAEWIIELAFEDVKAMFDPVIQRINSHIGNHLVTSKNKCDAMFLVGGGSENLYLQGQIKLAFGQYFTFIESPKQPITAIVRGAVQYEIEKTKNIPRVVPSMYELNNLNSMKNFQNSSIGKSHGSLHSISPGSVHSMPPGSLHNIPPGSLQYEPGSLQYQPVKSAIIPNENVHNGLENKMDALLIQDWNPFTNPFKLGSRTLRYTYGVQVVKKWKKGDPPERKTPNGLMNIFYPLIKANTIVKVDQAVGYVARPSDPQQKDMTFNIYVSQEINPKYCDERGMRHFGTLRVDLSDMHLGKKRLIEFSLVFGMSEVKAEAKNKKTGMVYRATMKS